MKLTIFDEVSTLPDLWDYVLKNVNTDEVFLVLGNQTFSYKQLNALAWCIAAYFFSKQLKKGDKIVLFTKNSPFGVYIDWAAQFVGGVSIYIPPDTSVEIAQKIIRETKPKFIFLSEYRCYFNNKAWLDSFTPQLEIICYISRDDELQEADRITDLSYAVEWGKIFWRENLNLLKERRNSLKPLETSTIFYFHTHTAKPLPYSFSHQQILKTIKLGVATGQHFTNQKVFLSILSQAYLLEKIAGFYFPLLLQTKIQFVENIDNILEDLRNIAPTCLVAKLDSFDFIFNKIKEDFKKQEKWKARHLDAALQIVVKFRKLKTSNHKVPLWLYLKAKVAYKFLLSKIKKKYFPSLQYIITEDVVYSEKWFDVLGALNIPVLVMSLGSDKLHKTSAHNYLTIAELNT
ncbi:MAG: AMP-binding protein [Bacteroidia bacterium]|nr:AMP-binding protein [Bacteroidia bacterium]MDW8159029.1 AMP-binding protein [Bacteroidia bacterium]